MTKAVRIGAMALLSGLALLALAYFVARGANAPDAAQQKGQQKQQQANQGQKTRLSDIASACASSVNEKGFGEFVVSSKTIISNEEGEIATPCFIKLERGGELTFNRVKIRSKALHIGDKEANGGGRVRLENSEFYGTDERSELFVRLSDPEDAIALLGSTLDYPSGILARIVSKEANGSASGEGGDIDVTGSTLRSLDPKSQGIELVTGSQSGKMNLVNLDVDTVQVDPDLDPKYKKTFFTAKDCHLENLRGVPDTISCDADDAKERISKAAKISQGKYEDALERYEQQRAAQK